MFSSDSSTSPNGAEMFKLPHVFVVLVQPPSAAAAASSSGAGTRETTTKKKKTKKYRRSKAPAIGTRKKFKEERVGSDWLTTIAVSEEQRRRI